MGYGRLRVNLALDLGHVDHLAGGVGTGHETLAGTRQFKLYRQLKMYNDPDLNPAIYRKPLAESGR